MKTTRFWGAVLLLPLVGLAVAFTSTDANAQKKPPPKVAPVAAEPPMTARPINLAYPGIVFGMSPTRVADSIDRMLDADYKPKYKDVSPGVQMRALDAALAEEKAAYRRSRIDFGRLPTGLDSSPLKGEFSYNNRETMMTLTRNGEDVHFFFIQDRLWKIIGEHKLTERSPYGKNFTDSVTKFAGIYGTVGRILQPDYKDRFAVEVDWRDSNDHLRIIQRGDTAIGLALEDAATWQSLASLRPNKPVNDNGIDPAVAAAMRKDGPPPGPPPPDKKKPAKH
jgi:hypothetical protein